MNDEGTSKLAGDGSPGECGKAGGREETAPLLARQALYRFASLVIADPRAGSFEVLSDPGFQEVAIAAADLVRGEASSSPKALGPRERPLVELDPSRVLQRLPRAAADLERLYEGVFGLVASGACPPHETDFIEGKLDFRRAQTLADVSGFYRAFGLKPSSRHPERHDHISLELEFMAFLLGLERSAWESREPGGAARRETCRRAQVRFLGEHLAWWVPAFAKFLEREAGEGFYAAVARFLAAWIPAERAELGVAVVDTPVGPRSGAAPGEGMAADACPGDTAV